MQLETLEAQTHTLTSKQTMLSFAVTIVFANVIGGPEWMCHTGRSHSTLQSTPQSGLRTVFNALEASHRGGPLFEWQIVFRQIEINSVPLMAQVHYFMFLSGHVACQCNRLNSLFAFAKEYARAKVEQCHCRSIAGKTDCKPLTIRWHTHCCITSYCGN